MEDHLLNHAVDCERRRDLSTLRELVADAMKPSYTQRQALLAALDGDRIVRFLPGSSASRMRKNMIERGWITEDGEVTNYGEVAVQIGPRLRHALPGNGPWKIDEHCPSHLHNTTYAARGVLIVRGQKVGKFPKCICPRALALWDEMRLKANAKYRNRAALPHWWQGPWRILDECPASGHNTERRALKPGKGRPACICPRAEALKAAYRQKKNAKRRAEYVPVERLKAVVLSAPLDGIGVTLYRAPD